MRSPQWRRTSIATQCFLLALWLIGAASAQAITIDFEDAPNGSDASRQLWEGGTTIGPSLVLDEATIEALTSHDAMGTWATSGTQGLLNALAAEIVFTPGAAFDSFSLEGIGLPNAGGSFQRVQAQLWSGNQLVLEITSDGTTLGDSGLHELHLEAAGFLADRLVVRAVVPLDCDSESCFGPNGERDSFFLDDVIFTVVPEPGTALLLLFGLGAVAVRRRGLR